MQRDGLPDKTTQERIAKNDATFREANEGISEIASANRLEHFVVICECAEPTCRELVRMTLPGHEGSLRRGGRRATPAVPGDQEAPGSPALLARKTMPAK